MARGKGGTVVRGTDNKADGGPGPEVSNEAIVKRLDKLVDSIGKLAEALTPVTMFVANLPASTVNTTFPAPNPEPATLEKPSDGAQVKMKDGFPVPYEYQELVNTILNKHFGVEINYLPPQAAFEFSILVPKKYSNALPAHWETYHEDRRMKVIQNAYGANGVREYLSQVYNNFPQDIQSAITYDRAQP